MAISDTDRHPRLHYAATIHHGIDIDQFDVHPGPGEDLLFFGRIHPDKGTAEAIEVARRAGAGSTSPASSRMRGISLRGRTAARRRARTLSGRRRRHGARRGAGRGSRPAAPHRLRGTVRVQRRGGDGLRHAGHRQRPRLDGRADRAWRHRLPGRGPRCGGGLGRSGRRTATGVGIAALATERFTVTAMVDAYVSVYRDAICGLTWSSAAQP